MGGCAGKSKEQAVDHAGDEKPKTQETQPPTPSSDVVGVNSNNDGSPGPRLSTISTPSLKSTQAKGAFNSSYMQKRAAAVEQTKMRRVEAMRHGLDERTRKLEQCAEDGEQMMKRSQRFSVLSELIMQKSQAKKSPKK